MNSLISNAADPAVFSDDISKPTATLGMIMLAILALTFFLIVLLGPRLAEGADPADSACWSLYVPADQNVAGDSTIGTGRCPISLT